MFYYPIQSTCDLNARNHLNLTTPLRLAAEREHSRIVEALVGYGADVNLACSDGHTPLHVVTTNKDMEKPTPQSPQLQIVSTYGIHFLLLSEVNTVTHEVSMAAKEHPTVVLKARDL